MEFHNIVNDMNAEYNELSGRIPSELASLERLNYLFIGRFYEETI